MRFLKGNRNAKDLGHRPDLDDPDVLHPTVIDAQQLLHYAQLFPKASCWEQCGNCETEFVMSAYRPEPCPVCGRAVLPCNMCDPDNVDCRECPYGGIVGAQLGPDNRSYDEFGYEVVDNRKPYGRRRR